jgi:hypothetical protein
MSPELLKQFESTNHQDMIVRLKGMFENQARVGRGFEPRRPCLDLGLQKGNR